MDRGGPIVAERPLASIGRGLGASIVEISGLGRTPLRARACSRTRFAFPVRGVHLLDDGSRELILDVTQAAITPAGAVTRERHPDAGDVCKIVVSLDDDTLEDVRSLANPGFDNGCACRPMTPSMQIAAQWLAGRAVGDRDARLVEEVALWLVAETCRSPAPQRHASQRAKDLIQSVKAWLASHRRPVSLGEAAGLFQVSPTHLTTLFSQVEGIPLYSYHLRLRIGEALRLLPETSDITGLALDLGFSSHSHFTTAFKRRFGVTPSSYRAAARRSVEALAPPPGLPPRPRPI